MSTPGQAILDLGVRAVPILLDGAAKGIAVMALAWAATGVMGKASAAARHLVWFCALASLLLLPALSVLLPAWRILPAWGVVATPSPARQATASPAPGPALAPATPVVRPDQGLDGEASALPPEPQSLSSLGATRVASSAPLSLAKHPNPLD